MTFSTLKIRDSKKFDPEEYPLVVEEELKQIKNQTSSFPSTYKLEIIVSYLKDHRLDNVWIDANPSLVKLITSRRMTTNGIESFLDSVKKHPQLLHDFEEYVRTMI
jgi:hypothetical protein